MPHPVSIRGRLLSGRLPQRTLLLLLLAAVGCGHETINVAPPEVSGEEAIAPPLALPPTTVVAPITLDLRSLLAELEETVPREFGKIDKASGFQVNKSPSIIVAVKLRRGRLSFDFKDNVITVSTILAYSGKAWVKTGFTSNVECGTGDVQPRMRLRLRVTYNLTADWRLATKTEVLEVAPMSTEPRDRCQISVVKYDATDKIAEAAKGGLVKALANADRKLARVSLEKPIGGIWATLQRPISIAKGTLWLQINPTAVALGGISASDSVLTVRLGLTASPQMHSGPRPADDTLPLPRLAHGVQGGDTAIVLLEGVMLYAGANQLLDAKVRGKSFKVVGRKINIDKIVASPGGGGKLMLAVKLKGRAEGTVYAVGTPQYDPATDLISVPDLAFEANTMSALGGALAWLVQGPLLSTIQDRAKLTSADLMKLLLELANKNINRELSKGIYLRGNLTTATPIDIRATHDGLTVRARSAGRLWLEIDKADWLPPPKRR
jgi:hypothetical protein